MLESAAGGPEVLLATSLGAHLPSVTMDSALAVALTVRGAQVRVLLCDQFLPACMLSEINWYPDPAQFAERGPSDDLCRHCFVPAREAFDTLGIDILRTSSLVSQDERREADRIAASVPVAEIRALEVDGVAVGEHAMAGALRFFARGDLDGEPHAERILRRYLNAALLTLFATRRLLEQHKFVTVVAHHGIYVPQGVICDVARRRGVRVVTWHQAYRRGRFIFSHAATYHRTLLSEPVDTWESIPWNDRLDETIREYLASRRTGARDWITFQRGVAADVPGIFDGQYSATVGLLTNVVWDAQLHYRANAFPDMLTWLRRTMEYFQKRPHLQLLIRVHPGEILGTVPSRQKVRDEIEKWFPRLPANIVVIGPEDSANTYRLMEQCDSVLIYGTKTGVELAPLGVPIVVAGEAWIRGKGLTWDANSAEEYFALLDRLPLRERLSDDVVQRARKYAFHFFFRRMIPVRFIEQRRGWPPFGVVAGGLRAFQPGSDPGLDVVCDGILEGREFVYRAEDEERHGREEHGGAREGRPMGTAVGVDEQLR